MGLCIIGPDAQAERFILMAKTTGDYAVKSGVSTREMKKALDRINDW